MGLTETEDTVRRIMLRFADETGLSSSRQPPRRYLWTDAHAVCNFLSLYGCTRDREYLRLACSLIDQVHIVLGRHRDDDPRSGWISGLSESDGHDHPTAGGLRIGKKLRERCPDDAFDDRLEWDRDGQYFHYLTKWMHALCRASAVTGEEKYCQWALELAKVAYAGFTTSGPGSIKRMHWKMSIDLSYPLIAASGAHDPLDAYVTFNEIAQCSAKPRVDGTQTNLEAEIVATAEMLDGLHWETEDPLGIGGLLFDASRVFQLSVMRRERLDIADALIAAVRKSLAAYARRTDIRLRAEHRLAFRELGLSIGLHAVQSMRLLATENSGIFSGGLRQEVDSMYQYVSLATAMERFWCEPHNQQAQSWLDHRDINSVMLATSLLPDEFLTLTAPN